MSYYCNNCKKTISKKVYLYSINHVGRALCYDCQKINNSGHEKMGETFSKISSALCSAYKLGSLPLTLLIVGSIIIIASIFLKLTFFSTSIFFTILFIGLLLIIISVILYLCEKKPIIPKTTTILQPILQQEDKLNKNYDHATQQMAINSSICENYTHPTPEEIFKKIDSAPPFQKDNIISNYNDIEIRWLTFLRSISLQNSSNVRLLLSTSTDYHGALVSCTVSIIENPDLKILPQGTKIMVSGKISGLSISGLSIQLNNALIKILAQ
jgi:hypothetical protein